MGFVVLGIVDFTGSKSGLPMPSGCRPEYGRRTRNDRGNSFAPWKDSFCHPISWVRMDGVPFILISLGLGVGFSVIPDSSFLSTSWRVCTRDKDSSTRRAINLGLHTCLVLNSFTLRI